MKFNINDITCMGNIANAIKLNEKYLRGTINDIHGPERCYMPNKKVTVKVYLANVASFSLYISKLDWMNCIKNT